MHEIRRLHHIHGFACFRPDWRLVAARGQATSKTVAVYYVEDGLEMQQLSGHSDMVRGAAFHPDGTILATAGGRDTTVRLWDVFSGKELQQMSGHTSTVTNVAFSPDGRFIAAASMAETDWGDNALRLWEVASGREVWCITEGSSITHITFHPDGALLASAGHKSAIISLRASSSGEVVQRLNRHGQGSFAFSPDWSILASVGDEDPAITLWDSANQQSLTRLERGRDFFSGIAFSPDGQLLASGGKFFQLWAWDGTAGRELRRLDLGRLEWLAGFSPDGLIVALAHQEGSMRLLEVGSAEELEESAQALAQQLAHQRERLEAGRCITCGKKISWIERLMRHTQCANCRGPDTDA